MSKDYVDVWNSDSKKKFKIKMKSNSLIKILKLIGMDLEESTAYILFTIINEVVIRQHNNTISNSFNRISIINEIFDSNYKAILESMNELVITGFKNTNDNIILNRKSLDKILNLSGINLNSLSEYIVIKIIENEIIFNKQNNLINDVDPIYEKTLDYFKVFHFLIKKGDTHLITKHSLQKITKLMNINWLEIMNFISINVIHITYEEYLRRRETYLELERRASVLNTPRARDRKEFIEFRIKNEESKKLKKSSIHNLINSMDNIEVYEKRNDSRKSSMNKEDLPQRKLSIEKPAENKPSLFDSENLQMSEIPEVDDMNELKNEKKILSDVLAWQIEPEAIGKVVNSAYFDLIKKGKAILKFDNADIDVINFEGHIFKAKKYLINEKNKVIKDYEEWYEFINMNGEKVSVQLYDLHSKDFYDTSRVKNEIIINNIPVEGTLIDDIIEANYYSIKDIDDEPRYFIFEDLTSPLNLFYYDFFKIFCRELKDELGITRLIRFDLDNDLDECFDTNKNKCFIQRSEIKKQLKLHSEKTPIEMKDYLGNTRIIEITENKDSHTIYQNIKDINGKYSLIKKISLFENISNKSKVINTVNYNNEPVSINLSEIPEFTNHCDLFIDNFGYKYFIDKSQTNNVFTTNKNWFSLNIDGEDKILRKYKKINDNINNLKINKKGEEYFYSNETTNTKYIIFNQPSEGNIYRSWFKNEYVENNNQLELKKAGNSDSDSWEEILDMEGNKVFIKKSLLVEKNVSYVDKNYEVYKIRNKLVKRWTGIDYYRIKPELVYEKTQDRNGQFVFINQSQLNNKNMKLIPMEKSEYYLVSDDSKDYRYVKRIGNAHENIYIKCIDSNNQKIFLPKSQINFLTPKLRPNEFTELYDLTESDGSHRFITVEYTPKIIPGCFQDETKNLYFLTDKNGKRVFIENKTNTNYFKDHYGNDQVINKDNICPKNRKILFNDSNNVWEKVSFIDNQIYFRKLIKITRNINDSEYGMKIIQKRIKLCTENENLPEILNEEIEEIIQEVCDLENNLILTYVFIRKINDTHLPTIETTFLADRVLESKLSIIEGKYYKVKIYKDISFFNYKNELIQNRENLNFDNFTNLEEDFMKYSEVSLISKQSSSQFIKESVKTILKNLDNLNTPIENLNKKDYKVQKEFFNCLLFPIDYYLTKIKAIKNSNENVGISNSNSILISKEIKKKQHFDYFNDDQSVVVKNKNSLGNCSLKYKKSSILFRQNTQEDYSESLLETIDNNLKEIKIEITKDLITPYYSI